ncbi:MAG: methionyl aminopeptidase [Patescibacteria group bacterium]|nr:methionyl aminopeptidase [Patescibacteria group bacterium]
MIYKKSEDEIKVLHEGGKILARILKTILATIRPGVMTMDLETMALAMIKEADGVPAFLDYPMGDGIYFPSALCISINEEVVHGSAVPNRELKSGDIVDIDIGMEWPVSKEKQKKMAFPINPHSQHGGYFTDMCATVGVGKISQEAKKLLNVTRRSLEAGIAQAKVGNRLNDIAAAIEKVVLPNYGIVRDLVGHGVGYFLHEEPDVFNYQIRPNSPENIELKAGMVIAIEPMINVGTHRIKIAKNNYTIITADGSLSAHFEHTVAITQQGPLIITA